MRKIDKKILENQQKIVEDQQQIAGNRLKVVNRQKNSGK